jgi:membrane fusion protein, multidrug efflux system
MSTAPQKPEWAQSQREKDNVTRVSQGLKPRRRRWPWILLALVIVAAVGIYFYLQSQPQPPAPVAQAEAAPAVMQLNPAEIITVAPQVLRRTIRVTGSLAPQQQTELASEVGGRVTEISVRPGDQVSAGQTLVQIDTDNLQLQLNQQRATAEATRAQLVLAQSQLVRTTDLIGRGLSPTSGLEEAQSSVDALRAQLTALEAAVSSAELSIRRATVTAPFDGVVSARSVEPDQTIASGAPLLTIVDMSTIELQGAAPVGVSAEIAASQVVDVTVEGLRDETFTGEVVRVNPVAAEGTRTIPVYIRIDNPDGQLRGGMFAVGQIVVEEIPEAIAVPTAAIREDAEGNYVLKVENDTAVRQAIVEGQAWDRGRVTEITEGLAVDDVIIGGGLDEIMPGDAVTFVRG